MEECLRAIVQIIVPVASRLRGLAEVAEGFPESRTVLLLGQGEYQRADCRTSRVGASVGRVAETALGRLARLEIFQASLDGRLRHSQAGVASSEQCHHLCSAHGGVGVGTIRRIAPASTWIFFLRVEYQGDGFLECRAKPVVLHRAVRLGQSQRCKAVVIHRGADVAGGLVLPTDDKVESTLDRDTVRAVYRVVPVREHRHHRQPDHRRRRAVGLVLKIATGDLRLHDELQALQVHTLDLFRQQVARLLKQFLRRGWKGQEQVHRNEKRKPRPTHRFPSPSIASTALK